MNHVITYNKTLQERLQEYIDVLGGYETLSVSRISKEWAFFLEVTIDSTGWQAIWKIPRSSCQELNIEFPTLALVYVESIDCSKLSANISVLSVDEEQDLAKKHCVPLIQLWPTKKQDESTYLNLAVTANAVDMLRFFYLNLLMPWDNEDDFNWLDKHLLSRLHLYYDLRNGTIKQEMAAHIKGLVTEARHMQERHQQLSQVIEDDDVDPDPNKQSLKVQKFLDVCVHMKEIQNELEVLENPSLRNFMVLANTHEKIEEDTKLTYWIVIESGKIEDFLTFLQRLQSDVGDVEVKFESTFELALQHAAVNDTIFLCNAKHAFTNLHCLQEGGFIKGISSASEVILSSTNEDVVIDCQGKVMLENLYIDARSAECGILVRSGGILTLKNCTVVGDYKCSTQLGIIVLAGGQLHIDDCEIKGFFNAVVANSGTTLSLNNSIIQYANSGLKCYSHNKITVQSTTFKDCRKYGIFVEAENLNMNIIGDFDVLLGIEEIKLENVTGVNNGKGNAKVNHKDSLEPICDLFSNSELDPTVIHDEEEEVEEEANDMEVGDLETTVVEMIVSV